MRRAIVFVRTAGGALSAGELELGKPDAREARVGSATASPRGGSTSRQLIRLADARRRPNRRRAGARGRSSRRRAGAALRRRRPRPPGVSTTAVAAGSRSGARRSTEACRRRWTRSPRPSRRLRRRVRRRPGRHRARPLSGARRPDRARPPARGRRAAGNRDEAGPAHRARALPRRAHGRRPGAPTPRGLRGARAAAVAAGSTRASGAAVDAAGGSACTWTSGDGADGASCSSCGCRPRTTRRSACPPRCCGAAATTSSPSSATATRGAISIRQLAELEPSSPSTGSSSTRPSRPRSRSTRTTVSGSFLREAMPSSRSAACPCCSPPRGCARPAAAPGQPHRDEPARRRSSGLLSPAALARFDWRLAIGDVELTEEELAELAAAKEPFIRVARPLACAAPLRCRAGASLPRPARAQAPASSTSSAPSRGSRPTRPGSSSARSRSTRRSPSCSTTASGASGPCPTPAAMQFDLFPFQERGHGWLRLLGDLGIGAILADDMGLGKTVQAIAMLALRARGLRRRGARPHARRLPDERRAPVGRARSSASRRRCASTCTTAATGSRARRSRRPPRDADVVVTSYDIATRDVDTLAAVAWDRLLLDEAQDVKNPATKRARALRRLRRGGGSR